MALQNVIRLSRKGVTDRKFDWEQPLVSGDFGDRSWLKILQFNSTKSLADTTRWLAWTVEGYGHVDVSIETIDLTEVRFERCTMKWLERRRPHNEDGVAAGGSALLPWPHAARTSTQPIRTVFKGIVIDPS